MDRMHRIWETWEGESLAGVGAGVRIRDMARTRIMYIENKSGGDAGMAGLVGPARIGRVTYSQTGRTLYYAERKLRKVGNGYKYNHVDEETGECFWISGPKRNGEDGLYGYRPVPIDEDVREEYWVEVRKMPAAWGAKRQAAAKA
jgi:hypothetical protein